jgi:hypothetical protein
MALPAVTESQLYPLIPIRHSLDTHLIELPIIGQYLSPVTIKRTYGGQGTYYGYMGSYYGNMGSCNVAVTLFIDNAIIETLYGNIDNGCIFQFTDPTLVTEALFKSKSIYLLIKFPSQIFADNIKYEASCEVGFISDEYLKEQLRRQPIEFVNTSNSRFRYYDGIVWTVGNNVMALD